MNDQNRIEEYVDEAQLSEIEIDELADSGATGCVSSSGTFGCPSSASTYGCLS